MQTLALSKSVIHLSDDILLNILEFHFTNASMTSQEGFARRLSGFQ
jgi:hypothetical protein